MSGTGVGVAGTTPTLCTVAQVKARIGIQTAEHDARIATLIDVVLPTANNRYGCEFMPRVAEARIFDVRTRLVELVGSDLHACTTVVLDPNGTPRTLVEGMDYVLVSCRLTGTYTEIRLSDALNVSSEYASRFGVQLEVTGAWGIWATTADVPGDINAAAIDCVLSWFDRPSAGVAGIESGSPRDGAPAIPNTWDIPSSAHRRFQPFNRNLGVY